MPERYPDDANLLARAADDATGVDYIPTGQSPYHLHFRRMLDRLLRVAERAGDLRPYLAGDLAIGVRPGRCTIGSTPVGFQGVDGLAVAPSAVTHVWLDGSGMLKSAIDGFPADRTKHIPIAEVVAGPVTIETLTDLRGETLLAMPDGEALGITASVDAINRALDGVSENVTAFALGALCDGPASVANALHTHTQLVFDTPTEADLLVHNVSSHPDAGLAIALGLPEHLSDAGYLALNRETGFLQQRYLGDTYNLLGATHVQHAVPGDLAASLSDRLIGVVPADGVVADVVFSLGGNLESSLVTDGVTATVRVNGNALCTTDPALTVGDGSGVVSTARGDGTPAVITPSGVQHVGRGDILTVDLIRAAAGAVSTEAHNAAVLIVIRNERPE